MLARDSCFLGSRYVPVERPFRHSPGSTLASCYIARFSGLQIYLRLASPCLIDDHESKLLDSSYIRTSCGSFISTRSADFYCKKRPMGYKQICATLELCSRPSASKDTHKNKCRKAITFSLIFSCTACRTNEQMIRQAVARARHLPLFSSPAYLFPLISPHM